MFEMRAEDIHERLASTCIGRLCMADGEGRPYAIPMPFCWHEGALYMRIPMAGRKGSILAANRQVCFEIDWHTERLDDYGSVLVEGRLEAVTDVEEKRRVRGVNEAKYLKLRGGHRPGHGRQTPIEQLSMQKIVVERVSGRQKMPAGLENAGPELAVGRAGV